MRARQNITMAHHLQHPSGMPYHIYQNVIGNSKPLAEAAHRAQITTFPPHSAAAVLLPTRPQLNIGHQVNVRGLTGQPGTLQIKQEPLPAPTPSAFITMHPNANVIWPNRYMMLPSLPVNKAEPEGTYLHESLPPHNRLTIACFIFHYTLTSS